jgi:hypothetical protein
MSAKAARRGAARRRGIDQQAHRERGAPFSRKVKASASQDERAG